MVLAKHFYIQMAIFRRVRLEGSGELTALYFYAKSSVKTGSLYMVLGGSLLSIGYLPVAYWGTCRICIAFHYKSILYITRTDLEKRMSQIRTLILLNLGGPLQLVVVLVIYFLSFHKQIYVCWIGCHNSTNKDYVSQRKNSLIRSKKYILTTMQTFSE